MEVYFHSPSIETNAATTKEHSKPASTTESPNMATAEPTKLMKTSRSNNRSAWKASLTRMIDSQRRIAPTTTSNNNDHEPLKKQPISQIMKQRALYYLEKKPWTTTTTATTTTTTADNSPTPAAVVSSLATPVTKQQQHHHGQQQLRNAMAWLGRSFQRLHTAQKSKELLRAAFKRNLSLPALSHSTASTMEHTADNISAKEQKQNDDESTGRPAFDRERNAHIESELKPGTRIIHCKVLQLINLSSNKTRHYQVDVRMNGVSQTMVHGTLSKSSKNSSCTAEPSSVFPIHVCTEDESDGPFELEFVVSKRHGHKGIIGRIASKTTAVVGVGHISSHDMPHFARAGTRHVKRCKLSNPNRIRGWDLDLTLELVCEQVVGGSAIVPQNRAPWTYYTYASGLSDLAVEDDDDRECDAASLETAQAHCTAGDYLTFYIHGRSFPTWERYWVVLKQDSLLLHDFSYGEQRGPAYEISLNAIERVARPTLDEQDRICLGRTHGLVLQVDPKWLPQQQQQPAADDDDESPTARAQQEEEEAAIDEGKIFLYADNATHALYWRRSLAGHDKSDNATHNSIHTRFLW